jgi:hypothetical protein
VRHAQGVLAASHTPPTMPLRIYDELFGGKPGAAHDTHTAMVKQYGAKRGNSVFYATIEKRKRARRRLAKPTSIQPRHH